jgi:S1-C subfamily serine protease
MTRHGLSAAALLALYAVGCGRPLTGATDPAYQWRDGRKPGCRADLILVDVLPPAAEMPADRDGSSPSGHTAAPIPDPILEQARGFTIAIRAIRDSASAGSQAVVTSSDQAAVPREPVLVEGTGVAIDRAGLILTSNHVVRRSDELEVWHPRRGWLPASVVGADPLNDLAVIGVDEPLSGAARLSAAGPNDVGCNIAALGFSPGAEPADGATALIGRMTGLHRSLQSALDPTLTHYYGDLLETTVPLQPGHSGGPLIDASGVVVGLNTAAVIQRSTGRRVGFAIPMSDHIRGIVARLAQGDTVVHSYLGVLVCTCEAHPRGVMIEGVLPSTPAARADLQPGDTILTVDDTAIESAAHFAELVRSKSPGGALPIDVLRKGHVRRLSVRPSSWP